jgi:rRNA-processing protein FCF1
MRPQTVRDMLNKYPISLENVIDIAKKLHIDKIWNENSYISDIHIKKIMKKFNEINSHKANSHNPNFKEKKVQRTTSTPFEQLIKDDYKIFIDTSSLMNYNALKVLSNEVIPYLKKYKKQLYIVDSVFNEIAKKERSSDASTVKQAKSARFVLSFLAKDDLYVIPETNSVEKNIADQELIACFTNYRIKHKLCLITNDNSYKKNGKLSKGILNLKKDPNVRNIKDIVVYFINQNKSNPRLVKFEDNRDSNFTFHDHAPRRVKL